jgi:hypothetical protein
MALRTGCFDIDERRDQAGMSSGLIGSLIIPGVADIAEIAKGMRLVPAGAVIVDRVLGLHLMTVLTG